MNKALKLTTLAAGLALTVWFGGSQPARASYSCYELNGTPCTTPGSYVDCMTEDNFQNTCTCWAIKGNMTWACPY